MKKTKNQLQAELCSTLQRRKVANKFEPTLTNKSENIIDTPITNYKNPNFVIPKNSTIKAIRKQTEELRSKDKTNGEELPKPPSDKDIENLSEIIAKLPQGEAILEEITKSMQRLQQQTTKENKSEKLMISHGKPNFVINPVKTSLKSTINNEKITSATESVNYSATLGKLKPVEHFHQQIKKQETEKKETSELRKKFEQLQTESKSKTQNEIKTAVELKTIAENINNNFKNDSIKISPKNALPFKQQKLVLSPQVTSQTIHHLSTEKLSNFEQKTTVSFSKELGAVPNRYPDMVKVTKTMDETSKSNTFLSNVKFIINSNGEVIVDK